MQSNLEDRFRDFVASDAFPCVGSKLALAQGGMHTVELGALDDVANDSLLLDALGSFARRIEALDPDDPAVDTLVALFSGPSGLDEHEFERLLWRQLQQLHDLDTAHGARWAADVARDPDNPKFSMSLAGHPFFVIGLHPGSSRKARRFSHPALVFNSHRQFDRLRADGRFDKMRKATRARDVAMQGSINPMLADYGEASEARQYSGRKVGPGWRCPLHVRSAA